MRKLSDLEQANAMYLAERDIGFSFLLPTATGLQKSIMDAVAPLREFLRHEGLHDYAEQIQGSDHKVCFNAVVVGKEGVRRSSASLYRPQTKRGDPRIWFRGLKSQITAGELLVIVVQGNIIYALSLSSFDYREQESTSGEFATTISELQSPPDIGGIAEDLLTKLREISRSGFIPAECTGSTAIGRTLESALGLQINSSPLPDYKGIELKSKRRESNTRKTLFAKVPDWNISSLKSFREFLDAYGYERNGLRRLNCSVSALRRNSQGLNLAVDSSLDLLLENGEKGGEIQRSILVWTLSTLRKKLSEKHRETFWVSAQTRQIKGREEFLFKNLEYTRSPHTHQLPALLSAGFITVDHLIKEKGRGAHERGPLFKINKAGYQLLFPSPICYDLGG